MEGKTIDTVWRWKNIVFFSFKVESFALRMFE